MINTAKLIHIIKEYRNDFIMANKKMKFDYDEKKVIIIALIRELLVSRINIAYI